MNNSVFVIGLIVFLSIYVVSTLGYLAFKQYIKFRELELTSRHLGVDDFRQHYENKVAELNERFTASEQRWRELNYLVVAGQRNLTDASKATELPTKSLFLDSHGIDPKSIKLNSKLLFVLTPFNNASKDDFDVITILGQSLGLQVSRGDEQADRGEIFSNILKNIAEARIIVANITGRNPNVYYELGIAHALDKACILITRNLAEVPFDLRSKQIVSYQNSNDLKDKLKQMLVRTYLMSI